MSDGSMRFREALSWGKTRMHSSAGHVCGKPKDIRANQNGACSSYARDRHSMPGRGFEPLRISPPDPKSGASANFATLADLVVHTEDRRCARICTRAQAKQRSSPARLTLAETRDSTTNQPAQFLTPAPRTFDPRKNPTPSPELNNRVDISKSYPVRLGMRLWRKNGDRVLVVGIFQSPKTGRAVLKNLHRARSRRAAAIHASARGRPRVEEHGISAIGGSATGSVLSLGLGAFIFWQRGMLADYRPAGLALLLAAFALAGALTGWILVRLLQEHVAAASLARCASTILPGETVVLAEIRATETSRLLAIMRDVEAEAPVTFAFHSPPRFR